MNPFFSKGTKSLAIIGLLGLSLGSCQKSGEAKYHDHHHGNDSLTVWTADRLEIQNLIYAYGVEWDQQNEDKYFDLYTNDAEFVVEQPGAPKATYKVHSEFKPIALGRWKAFKEKGFLRRHLINNIYFKAQSKDAAEIVVYGVLGNVAAQKYSTITSVYYEGKLVKTGGKWKIKHWIDKPDALLDIPVEASNATSTK